MPKLTYRGNPGYEFPFADKPLEPGDTVDVPADLVDSLGEDFEAKSKPSAAPAADTEEPTP